MTGAGGLLGFAEALGVVLECAASVPTPEVETVDLLASPGRVLAGDVIADRDQPPFDRATRDGYAVRAEAFSRGDRLAVVGEVRAGESWLGAAVGAGSAIGIMTGAALPAGADSVAMIEHVAGDDGSIRAAAGRRLKPGENVVARGREARAGDAVVAAGVRIGAAEIALAANCGCGSLRVRRRPRVAILATGDELVAIDAVPGERQIRNSNSYALAALVAEAGGEPLRLAPARDTLGDLRERIAGGREAELLLLSGGVSAGKYDLVEVALAEFGAEFLFTGVAMQPGKPVVFGRLPAGDGIGERYFFGLPGNPISTQVTFHCFVEPMLRAMCGAGVGAPRFVQATLGEAVAAGTGLTRLLPARLMHDLVRPEVRVLGWQGSGDLAANARANCYAVLPEGKDVAPGEVITVLLR